MKGSRLLSEQLRTRFPDAVLKGGTALSRVYLAKIGVSRFSEYIDLDFVSDMALDKKISVIKEKVVEIEGFEIRGPRILHRTLRFDCHYVNEFGDNDRIRIEFYLTRTEFVDIQDTPV